MSNHPQVEPLLRIITVRLPELAAEVFAPVDIKNGWVDLATPAGQKFVVECRCRGGYGLSSVVESDDPMEGYCEGADEVFDKPEQVAARLEELIALKGTTKPGGG